MEMSIDLFAFHDHFFPSLDSEYVELLLKLHFQGVIILDFIILIGLNTKLKNLELLRMIPIRYMAQVTKRPFLKMMKR